MKQLKYTFILCRSKFVILGTYKRHLVATYHSTDKEDISLMTMNTKHASAVSCVQI